MKANVVPVKVSEVVIRDFAKIEARKGVIKPEDVVDYAKDENSPIHNFFEWDDTAAAEKLRKMQARLLIKAVRVTIEDRPAEAFHNVKITVNNEPTQGYVGVKTVMSSKELTEQVKSSAVKELKYWQKKYEDLSDLQAVIDVDKLEEIEAGL